MQNAKDTFYVMLQGRLAALNPSRMIAVRGLLRPGIVVEENELSTAATPMDAFRLQWTGMRIDSAGPLPLIAMECEIHYATDGSPDSGGMDRGRLLAAMDAELESALGAEPRTVSKMRYTEAGSVAMGTNVFWAGLVFGSATAVDQRLERTATVQVFAYEEAGER